MRKKAIEVRNKMVVVRLNQSEYERLQKLQVQTTETTISSYLRKLALQKPVTVKYRNASADDFLQDMAELFAELKVVTGHYSQAVTVLHLLERIDEFRSWIQVHESSGKILFSRVDEIHFKSHSTLRTMVAKMTFPHQVCETLRYHEQKVKKGDAKCIGASGFLRDAHEMDFHLKLVVLENRNMLNDQVTTGTLHVSLNFDPSETLTNDTLFEIAKEYIRRIGFSGQPFLVYRHYDAGHLHVHIVSSTIRPDGSRIQTHNLGRNQSEKARKQIESCLWWLKQAVKRRKWRQG
jgi:hypothetical protein